MPDYCTRSVANKSEATDDHDDQTYQKDQNGDTIDPMHEPEVDVLLFLTGEQCSRVDVIQKLFKHGVNAMVNIEQGLL